MKKQLLASLLILSPIIISAMEDTSSFSSLSSLGSYFPWHLNSQANESELVSNLQKNKDEFEYQLKVSKRKELAKYSLPFNWPLFAADKINDNPIEFLQYCYYQKFHDSELSMSLKDLKDSTLLNKCQNAHIKGHSALSATMFAPDVSFSQKRDFNQQLINLNFKATP